MAEFDLQKFLWNSANKSIKDGLNESNRHNEQLDKIVVWLVGFSVTAITLVIGNFESKNNLLKSTESVIIVFASLVILFGLLSRIFSLLFHKHQIELIYSFDQFVQGYNVPNNTKYTRFVSDRLTIPEVLEHIKRDFNSEFNVVNIPAVEDEEYNSILTACISEYNRLQQNSLSFELNLFNRTLFEHLGKKIPVLQNIPNNLKTSFTEHISWKYLQWFNHLFNLTCITFILGILAILAVYLKLKLGIAVSI